MWLITQWGNWAGRCWRCVCGCIWFISVRLYSTQCSFLCLPSVSYEWNHALGNLKFVLLKLFLNVSIVLEKTLTLKTKITAFKFMVLGWGEWIELPGESDTTERLIWSDLIWCYHQCSLQRSLTTLLNEKVMGRRIQKYIEVCLRHTRYWVGSQ